MENNIISSKIKELRLSLGLTQAEFAESINTTQAALSGYERGDRTPSLDVLSSIAQTCNVSIDWLCGLSDSKNLFLTLTTYADLIKLLLLLYDAPEIEKNFDLKNNSCAEPFGEPYSTFILEINDKHIIEFYKEWKEINSIRSKTPSGDKLYSIWLKDIYERFDFKLENAKQSCNYIDENLPFN